MLCVYQTRQEATWQTYTVTCTIKQDHPVPIGYGETISAPHMHAEALRLLEDHCLPGASVLDVGSGSCCLHSLSAM